MDVDGWMVSRSSFVHSTAYCSRQIIIKWQQVTWSISAGRQAKGLSLSPLDCRDLSWSSYIRLPLQIVPFQSTFPFFTHRPSCARHPVVVNEQGKQRRHHFFSNFSNTSKLCTGEIVENWTVWKETEWDLDTDFGGLVGSWPESGRYFRNMLIKVRNFVANFALVLFSNRTKFGID